jgi:hypothetical protein
MRLGLMVGYSGATISLPMEMIKLADRLGYYAVWTAEAYGSDAVAPLAWIGAQTERIHLGTAIMQMPARTPANTAMTAMTLDQLSGGRMLLGLGLSGPQVVEGWHGVAYGKPLGKTREYVAIVRKILARQEPLVHAGEHYRIPYAGDDATGLGKPLKSILHGRSRPAHLPGRHRAKECRVGCGNRRRLAADLLLAGCLRCGLPCARGSGFRQSWRRQDDGRFRHCAQRAGGPGRRRRRLPRLDQALPGALRGRHGRARQELLL